MKRLTERKVLMLLGIGIGVTAGAVLQLAVKVADTKMDVLLRKLNMKGDLGEIPEEVLKAAVEAAAEDEEGADEECDNDDWFED